MITAFISLIIIVSLLLILVVMVQNPKGGGLASSIGGGANTSIGGGVKKTGDFLDKSTWTLGIILAVLIIGSNTIVKKMTLGTIEENTYEQEISAPQDQQETENTETVPNTEDDVPNEDNQEPLDSSTE